MLILVPVVLMELIKLCKDSPLQHMFRGGSRYVVGVMLAFCGKSASLVGP